MYILHTVAVHPDLEGLHLGADLEESCKVRMQMLVQARAGSREGLDRSVRGTGYGVGPCPAVEGSSTVPGADHRWRYMYHNCSALGHYEQAKYSAKSSDMADVDDMDCIDDREEMDDTDDIDDRNCMDDKNEQRLCFPPS